MAATGVIGLHVRSLDQNAPQFVQLVGDAPGWTKERLDRLAGEISALTVSNGKQPVPIPLFLASQTAATIPNFVEAFRGAVEDHSRLQCSAGRCIAVCKENTDSCGFI